MDFVALFFKEKAMKHSIDLSIGPHINLIVTKLCAQDTNFVKK